MIFVNFKTYKEGTGERAVGLARICQEVSQSLEVKVIPVVQVVDLWRVKEKLPKLEVWVQHIDAYPQGQYTGFTSLEAVAETGAKGTLLNHSEHKIPPGTVKQIIKRTKNWSASQRMEIENFKTMVCCKSLGQAEKLIKLKPSFLAYEPPELIGSREKSVASEEPKVIKKIVKLASPVPVVVGAGINSFQDVKISLKMGACGILVSSGVVLSKNPKKVLSEFASQF